MESTWYREDKDAGDEVALKNNLPPYEYNMASSMSHHGSVEDCFENINSFTTRSLSQFSHDLWRRPPKSISALNSLLPEDVRVKSIRRVPVNFNVRFCIGKIYSYTYHLDPIEDPFLLRYRCSLRDGWRLDLDAMAAAASLFEGTHDFGFFSSKSRDGRIRSSIRTIQRCQIVPVIDGIKMEVHGTGFLYKQVFNRCDDALRFGSAACVLFLFLLEERMRDIFPYQISFIVSKIGKLISLHHVCCRRLEKKPMYMIFALLSLFLEDVCQHPCACSMSMCTGASYGRCYLSCWERTFESLRYQPNAGRWDSFAAAIRGAACLHSSRCKRPLSRKSFSSKNRRSRFSHEIRLTLKNIDAQ